MRRSRLGRFGRLLAVGGLAIIGLGAAPATPSYHGVERAIEDVRKSWSEPGAPPQPNAPGWNAFFDALTAELRRFASARDENERLASLNRLYRMWVALETTPWRSGQELRDVLRDWLRPRIKVAWAGRRLVERVQGMAPTASPEVRQNRERWLRFVDGDLGRALRRYDGAATVAQRQEALDRLYAALDALRGKNAEHPWIPAATLQAALDDLYDRPNLDISADVATLAPVLSADVVQNGPIWWKGYLSQVTAGQKLGFGLLASDNGIAFYNSQMMTSVTPIHDFQSQIASQRRGRFISRLYQFSATSTDAAALTVVAVLTPTGLQLGPQYQHNVDALIGSIPQPGRGLARGLLALIGLNRGRITGMVYQQALPRLRQSVAENAAELGAIRSGQEAAARNATLARYLIGGDRLAFRNLLIEDLSLRSRPENALIGGTLHWLNARNQVGADLPQPASLAVPAPGVSADLHLGSILTSLARGYFQSDAVKDLNNLMLVTRKIPPDAPPQQGIETVRNADYPTFLKAVAEAQAANDPKVLAVRVKRPGTPPEFSADARGFLVAGIHDFLLDVPAPPQAARGGRLTGPPARVYRIASPRAEAVISFKVSSEAQTSPVRLAGRIEELDLGPNARVYAINEDESKAQPLNAFTSAFVMGLLRSRVQGQPIDVPLSNLQLRGFAIRRVSPLDPTGWIRVQLERTSASPAAGIQ